jgi:catechol 2,3-dioxygenase-like lactoylglutathione lyase family enzyme
MANKWQLIGVNHVNAIVDGYQDSVAHFRDRLGFDLPHEIPDSGDGTDACLMTFGNAMFEFFAPKERGEKGQGRLLDKFGDHFIGVEYQVPSTVEAREFANENGIRIINDLGAAFFTYPGASFGIAWEIYDGDFKHYHKPASYWLEEHPMALTGIDHLTVAVEDLDASLARLQEITNASVLGKVAHSAAGSEGVRLKAGNIEWELVTPTGAGPVASYIDRYGERIRSVTWKSADLAKARGYLQAQGFDVVDGDADGSVAIPPEQNKNLLFEFTA